MKRIKFILAILGIFFLREYSSADVLEDLEKTFSNIAKDLGPSVVCISTVKSYKAEENVRSKNNVEDSIYNEFLRKYLLISPKTELYVYGLGSGMIVRSDGYVLTNQHVIDKADRVEVVLSTGEKYPAEIVGKDMRSDLAVLKINAVDLKPVLLGDSSNLKIGQWVIAIGHPYGFLAENNEATLTVGIVSSIHRKLSKENLVQDFYDFELIQTDAAINPGNSGGPLVNLKGEVIGINMAQIWNQEGFRGLGMAIPIHVAKGVIDQLIKGEGIVYGWLGVGVGYVNKQFAKETGLENQKGAMVLKVFKNSAAENYHIREMDIIKKINQYDIETPEDLIREASKLKAGEKVSVEIFRKGEYIQMEIMMGSSKEQE